MSLGVQIGTVKREGIIFSSTANTGVPGPGSRVCSDHFISSKSAGLFNQTNLDLCPPNVTSYSDLLLCVLSWCHDQVQKHVAPLTHGGISRSYFQLELGRA